MRKHPVVRALAPLAIFSAIPSAVLAWLLWGIPEGVTLAVALWPAFFLGFGLVKVAAGVVKDAWKLDP